MVEVTQEDRDAAASGYYAWIGPNPRIPEKMVDGNADDHSIVQAFARHREAALTTAQAEADALRAEVERLREALREFVDGAGMTDDADVLLIDARTYETALKALSEPMP